MLTTETTNLDALAEKLQAIADAIDPQSLNEAQPNLPYERAYTRLQQALQAFGDNPDNIVKSKSLNNAIDSYETAVEMLLTKAQSVFEQAEDIGIDCSAVLLEKYGTVLKKLN
ncbi:hypothetical protein AAKU67_003779 [Oxalobacteraceae bacterium GrIS 2.11]